MAIIPPFSVASLLSGRAGRAQIALNLGVAAFLVATMALLSYLTGNIAQWLVFGIGIYATVSWVQNLALRDRAAFTMMFRCKAFLFTIFGFCSINFVAYGLAVWMPSFFIRVHGMDVGQIGMIIGLSVVEAGGVSINLVGYLSDRWKARNPRGRLYFGMITIALTIPAALILFSTGNTQLALVMNFVVAGLTAIWPGPATSSLMDLVLPRMRAITGAFYFLLNVFLGLAIGPYLIGLTSDLMVDAGNSPAHSLRTALVASVFTLLVPLALLLVALRHLEADESSRLSRARQAGEPGL